MLTLSFIEAILAVEIQIVGMLLFVVNICPVTGELNLVPTL